MTNSHKARAWISTGRARPAAAAFHVPMRDRAAVAGANLADKNRQDHRAFLRGQRDGCLPRAALEHIWARLVKPSSLRIGLAEADTHERRRQGGAGRSHAAGALQCPGDRTPQIQAMPYDPVQDFAGITPLGNGNVPLVLVISRKRKSGPSSATTQAKPGSMNYAAAGIGTPHTWALERFRLARPAGSFRGAPEALTEVMTGRVNIYSRPIARRMRIPRRQAAGAGGQQLQAHFRFARRSHHSGSGLSEQRFRFLDRHDRA